MEALVQKINFALPDGLVLDALANKFTASRRLRAGKIPVVVQPKQVGLLLPRGDPIQGARFSVAGESVLILIICLGVGVVWFAHFAAGVVLVPETPVLS